MRKSSGSVLLIASAMLSVAGGRACAQVVFDNFTLGNVADDMILIPDANNTFNITEDRGVRAENNLFHSFHEFSIAAGETALFSGDANISNVVSRVTGGDVSLIDGTISSTIAGANFWIVNPAGMIFGADAVIDVGGTFNAGAADFIAFPGDLQYSAFDGSITLSVAGPEEFGFLDTGGGLGEMQIGPDPSSGREVPGVSFALGDSRHNGLSFAGRSLALTNSVIGSQADPVLEGDIKLDADSLRIVNSTIYLNTDNVNEFSVDLPGQILIHADGALEMIDAYITADSLADGIAGQIDIDALTVRLVRTHLTSGSTPTDTGDGTGFAGTVEIEGTDGVELHDSFVTTATYSDARIDFDAMPNLEDVPGSIEINAPNGEILIVDAAVTAMSAGKAHAGFIELNGRTVVLRGADIDSTSEADDGGWAGDILIVGSEGVVIEGLSRNDGLKQSSLSTNTSSRDINAPGTITIDSSLGDLVIRDSALTSDTFGASDAGFIDLDGNSVMLERVAVTSGTLGDGDFSAGTFGAAGIIDVHGVERVDVRDSSLISDSFSNAGDLSGDLPGEITLSSGGVLEMVDSLIAADSLGDGIAGQIDLDGRIVRLVRTHLTSGSTPTDTGDGTGFAGIVEIEGTDSVELRDSSVTTETYSDARIDFDATPNLEDVPGSIEINAPNGEVLLVGSDVTATTFGRADAGFIELNGRTVVLQGTDIASTSEADNGGWAGYIVIRGTEGVVIESRTTSDGLILSTLRTDTQSQFASSEGFIIIQAASGNLLVRDSDFTATTSGASDAGYIDLGGANIVLDNTILSSTSTGENPAADGAQGDGGDLALVADSIFIRNSGVFARADQGNGGFIQLTVNGADQLFIIDSESEISADSGSGINGEVDINAPDADLAASLQQQDANIVVAPGLAADACSPAATGELSTFVQEDEGGTPVAPDRYLNADIRIGAAALAAGTRQPAGPSNGLLAAVVTDPREACR